MAQSTDEPFDIAPDQITPLMWDDLKGANLAEVGNSQSPIASEWKSRNYIPDTQGWMLSSNGTHDGFDTVLGGSDTSATIVIGPSSNSDSADYDFVTDGTADNVEIAAAIAALPAGGGKIVFREGTYNLAATIVIATPHTVHLEGMGKSTIFNAQDGVSTSGSSGVFNIAADYAVISDIMFDGGDLSTANAVNAIYHSAGVYQSIRRCYFVDFTGACIKGDAPSGQHIDVDGCFFSNWDRRATGTSWALEEMDAGTIRGCHFDAVANTGAGYVQAQLSSIVGCRFRIPDLYDPPASCINGHTVVGCYFYLDSGDTLAGGRIIEGGRLVADCVFDLAGAISDSTYIIEDVICVVNNTINGGPGGITITSAITNIGGQRIANNVIYDLGRIGINLASNADNVSVTGNIIKNVGQATSDTYAGIHLASGATNVTIQGNVVVSDAANKHKYGINEASGAGPCTITGNILQNAVTANLNTTHASTVSANNITA